MVLMILAIAALAVLTVASGVHSWYTHLSHADESGELRDLVGNLSAQVTEIQQGFNDLDNKPQGDISAIIEVVEELASQMDQFERDLEEGLDVARRRENRVRAAVSRALTRMEEEGGLDPALEAEISELRRRDGEPSEPEAVPTVPEGVEDRSQSSIPGFTKGDLKRYGIG